MKQTGTYIESLRYRERQEDIRLRDTNKITLDAFRMLWESRPPLPQHTHAVQLLGSYFLSPIILFAHPFAHPRRHFAFVVDVSAFFSARSAFCRFKWPNLRTIVFLIDQESGHYTGWTRRTFPAEQMSPLERNLQSVNRNISRWRPCWKQTWTRCWEMKLWFLT